MHSDHSWYSDTAHVRTVEAALWGSQEQEVAVVGGGLAGLNAALELAQRGHTVALLEAQQVGWGASGRNGGFVSAGYAASYAAIARRCGEKAADQLYQLSRDGVSSIRRHIAEMGDDSLIHGERMWRLNRYRDEAEQQRELAWLQQRGVASRAIEPDELQQSIGSSVYRQGIEIEEALHIHPLNYCLALKRRCLQAGVRFYENTPVLKRVQQGEGSVLHTPDGKLKCKTVVWCSGGYTDNALPRLRRAMVPIATFILVTEVLSPEQQQLVATRCCVLDNRRASNYFRLLPDGRLLWGCGISAFDKPASARARFVHRDLCSVFPALEQVTVDYCWSGLMGYARHQMPHVQQISAGLWCCSAFGGHGLNTATVAGTVVARAISEGHSDHLLFKPFALSWTGGSVGPWAAEARYRYEQCRDTRREQHSD